MEGISFSSCVFSSRRISISFSPLLGSWEIEVSDRSLGGKGQSDIVGGHKESRLLTFSINICIKANKMFNLEMECL
jgi:hypothetical protein